MKRKIIKIDKEKCNGCGLCVNACHEGAIALVDGKAELIRDDYCDGLGDCLPVCPTNAISFEEREALSYDKEAVERNLKEKNMPCGCPGSNIKTFGRGNAEKPQNSNRIDSQLLQWPVQIKLVSPTAPYFDNCDLLVAADCTAFSYGNFHSDFIKNHITVIGCPKLDSVDYSEKLAQIISLNNIKSVTVARMEVPCCGGIVNAVKTAVTLSQKDIPLVIKTISTDGNLF